MTDHEIVAALISYATLTTIWLVVLQGGNSDLAAENRRRKADNAAMKARVDHAEAENVRLLGENLVLLVRLRDPGTSATVLPFRERGGAS